MLLHTPVGAATSLWHKQPSSRAELNLPRVNVGLVGSISLAALERG